MWFWRARPQVSSRLRPVQARVAGSRVQGPMVQGGVPWYRVGPVRRHAYIYSLQRQACQSRLDGGELTVADQALELFLGGKSKSGRPCICTSDSQPLSTPCSSEAPLLEAGGVHCRGSPLSERVAGRGLSSHASQACPGLLPLRNARSPRLASGWEQTWRSIRPWPW